MRSRAIAVRARRALARSFGLTVAFSVVLLMALVAAPAARGWSNGGNNGNGFGTHDWVLKEADRLAGIKGAGWVKLGYALPMTDDPDTQLHDYYYHVFDIWGSTYGNAPFKIALYYNKALSYRRQGRIAAASKMVGMLSHYYSDICNPIHTDQTDAEERMHSAYEGAVLTRTNAPGENRGWVAFNGYQPVGGIVAKARAAAVAAHPGYGKLVRAYNSSGFNTTVRAITKASLSRAANGLADIIITLKRKAP